MLSSFNNNNNPSESWRDIFNRTSDSVQNDILMAGISEEDQMEMVIALSLRDSPNNTQQQQSEVQEQQILESEEPSVSEITTESVESAAVVLEQQTTKQQSQID